MHLSEGILPLKPAVLALSVVFPFIVDSYVCGKKNDMAIRREDKKPFLTLAFALCFSVTLLPVPVPIAGASSHLCASPLLALMLGPRLVTFPVLGVLLLQAVFFAHGGLSTLGANVLTLGVVGPWMTVLIFKVLERLRVRGLLLLGASCFLGSLAVYFADSAILGWALSEKQQFGETFRIVTLGFLPVQGPLSVLEGVLSASILSFLAKYREDFVSDDILNAAGCKTSVPVGLSTLTGIFLLFLSSGDQAVAGGFKGIDDTVFTKVAEDLNVFGWELFPWLEGEVELFFFSTGFFLSGFFAGLSVQKLKRKNSLKEAIHG